jgi:23S rRNA (uracil1939-C5)-methyltransferase
VRLAQLDEIEVVVEKLVAGGDGLARFEGIPLFIPRSAPGDRARVRIVERRPDYGRAEIVELLDPGPGRRQAPCPYFDECGGCDLQHLEDALQVELKAQAVRETLARLGGMSLPAETEVVSAQMWGYRLRTSLHTEVFEGRARVGYFARGSRRLVPVARCPILVSALEGLLPELPQRLGERPPRRLDLVAGESGRVSSAPVVADLPHGEISLRVAGKSYALDARCFFQAHVTLVDQLVARVVGEWEGKEAVDLYAGVGLFSLPLADRYEKVVAVEGDRIAARYARQSSRRHRATRMEVVSQAVESWVPRLGADTSRVVVDPPRAGLSRPVLQALLERPPERLTYVSCHAATLARDLRLLGEVFALEEATLFDMFPQSGHMEVVVQLKRGEAGGRDATGGSKP